MYVYHITRKNFEYENGTPCENNPQKVIACDPAADRNYVFTPQQIEQDTIQIFQRTQIQTVISPNTFTAQDAGICFQKYFSDFTLQLFGKAISYEFITKQTSDILPDNPYKILRFGLHDYRLNSTPFSTLDWFTDACINLFGYPCSILTQKCGLYFPTALFLTTCYQFKKFQSHQFINLSP